MTSLALFTLCDFDLAVFLYYSGVAMLNFACFLEGNKHSGSQFDLQSHFRFLAMNISREINYLTLDNKLINNISELITLVIQ